MISLKHSHSACLVLAGALIAGSAMAAGSGAQHQRATRHATAEKTVVYQGVQVAIDPVTGRLRQPTAAERQALTAAMLQQRAARLRARGVNRPMNELEARATIKRHSRGLIGMSMQLPVSQMSYVTAERQPDGSLSIHHEGGNTASQAQEVLK